MAILPSYFTQKKTDTEMWARGSAKPDCRSGDHPAIDPAASVFVPQAAYNAARHSSAG